MLKRTIFLAMACFLVISTAEAIDDLRYIMSLSDASGPEGSSVDVPVMLDDPLGDPLSGWALGICQDGPVSAVAVSDGSTTAMINGGGAPDFQMVELLAGGCTVEVTIDFDAVEVLVPANGHELHIVTFDLVSEGMAEVSFCHTLGDPPLQTTLIQADGLAVSPVRLAGEIEILPPPPPPLDVAFLRGDCNDDTQVNIADGIWLLNMLFKDGPHSPCFEACNANDSANLDIEDAFFILEYQLLDGPPPAAPFPDCGIDAGSPCESFSTCP